MHFRPRCVCGCIHLRMETPLCGRSGGHAGTAPTVLFGWIACKWLFCLCGLCANGHFICVGLRGKILRSVVGAVPVCPPVSHCRGAFVVHPPRIMRVFLVWKRHCADVRAGTQAPPLRVSFGWVMMCDEKEYNPQGGSLLAYIITQGRLRCTCQPCAIESKTALR